MNSSASNSLERRKFVALCLAGTGAVAGAAFLGLKMSAGKTSISRTDYLQQLNTVFRVTNYSAPSETRAPVALRLVNVSESTVRPAGERRFEAYSILFEGPAASLEQQTVTIQHPQLGEQQLFLVPVGKPGQAAAFYEASFSTFQ